MCAKRALFASNVYRIWAIVIGCGRTDLNLGGRRMIKAKAIGFDMEGYLC